MGGGKIDTALKEAELIKFFINLIIRDLSKIYLL